MKAMLVGLWGAVVLGGAGLAWRELAAARRIRTASAELARENAGLSAALAQSQERRATAERESQARAPATTTRMDAVLPGDRKTGDGFDPVAYYRRVREKERDPKVQAVRPAAVQARDRMRYGLFFRRLGLTSEQIECFNRINADRLERIWDLREVVSDASKGGAAPAEVEAAVAKLRAQVEAECEAARRTLLRESGYREFREYQRSLVPREIVADIAGAAVLAGVPVSAGQAEQLTQILANASSDYRAGGNASDRTIDWMRVDEQARGVLTGEQWELFRTTDPLGAANSRFRGAYAQQLMEGITRAEQAREKAEAAAGAPSG